MVGCLMQKGTFLQTKVLDDLKLGNGEILKIQIRGNRHGCLWRSFRGLFEVGMICLDAELKIQGFSKPKLFKIQNLVMQNLWKFKSERNGSARFWEGFWKVFEGGFWYDVEGCEVHPKWSLALAGEKVGNAVWKESKNGRSAICKQKGFGPKKVWHIFVEIGFIRHRDHSLIFGKFSEQDKIGSLCKTRI